jgi:hypothetical protein
MKVLIAGGRKRILSKHELSILDFFKIEEIVFSAKCCSRNCIQDFAFRKGIKIKRFKTQEQLYGAQANAVRNESMVRYADGMIIFPEINDGGSLIAEAERAEIVIFDYRDKRKSERGKG